jgi:hypothetical protein
MADRPGLRPRRSAILGLNITRTLQRRDPTLRASKSLLRAITHTSNKAVNSFKFASLSAVNSKVRLLLGYIFFSKFKHLVERQKTALSNGYFTDQVKQLPEQIQARLM